MTPARPAATRKPKPRKFFELSLDLRVALHNIEFANQAALTWPGGMFLEGKPDGSGGLDYPETPRLTLQKNKRTAKLPHDLDAVSGAWLVSERLKQVFETVDPEGFAFAACDFTLPDGSKGPQYYICDVVRTIEALDEEKSENLEIIIEPSGHKYYRFLSTTKLVFKEEAVGPAHAFRMRYSSPTVICDSALRDACKAVEPKLRGLSFTEVSKS
jgi:hypothetical protein